MKIVFYKCLAMIKVVVVEDNQTIREGLQELINGTKNFSCLAVYPKCETLLKDIKKLSPDVLLIDIGLPGMSGIEGIKLVKKNLPELSILVLTVYEENDLLFSALCSGACGYIVKKTPSKKLLQIVEDAYYGNSSMSSIIANKIIKLFREKRKTDNKGKIDLTNREKDILNKLMEGFSIKAIADLFLVDNGTIGSDFRNIFRKLHLYSNAELNRVEIKDRKSIKI